MTFFLGGLLPRPVQGLNKVMSFFFFSSAVSSVILTFKASARWVFMERRLNWKMMKRNVHVSVSGALQLLSGSFHNPFLSAREMSCVITGGLLSFEICLIGLFIVMGWRGGGSETGVKGGRLRTGPLRSGGGRLGGAPTTLFTRRFLVFTSN